jgi:plastocyanin
MRFKQVFLTTAVVLIFAFFMSASPPAQSDSQSTKRPYQRTLNEGVIAGTVAFIGRPPAPRRIDMSTDPICAKSDPRAFMEDIVVRRGRLVNVFVYVKTAPVLEGLSFDTPSSPVVLDQRACRFVPHVFGIQVSQTLETRNSDPTIHNVHAVPMNNPDWNQSQPPGGEPIVSKFGHPDVMVPIKCNQHPWMKALVGVLPHPFFAVSDRNGNFRIEGLPAGKYTIAAWHERFGEKTSEVTVSPGPQSRLDFVFNAKDYPNMNAPWRRYD